MKSVMSQGKEWWLRRRADPRLKNNNKTTRMEIDAYLFVVGDYGYLQL